MVRYASAAKLLQSSKIEAMSEKDILEEIFADKTTGGIT
jgi:hypothetical protein